ncbi:MAG TPA: peroxiredoxin [Candidatus Bathyarchaeia archaeon]|nr:peroxiredoxin [Candidatus Bathyarchaeia archaeon]
MQSSSSLSLQEGMPAPEFRTQTTDGKTVTLRDYLGRRVVLYFYPKDDTPGCTVEACGLRDQYQKIRELGAEVVGVSVDDTSSHRKFTEKFNLPFQLAADTDRTTSKLYGVLNDKSNMSKRVTFIIDEQGKIEKIFETVKPQEHAQEILDALKDER